MNLTFTKYDHECKNCGKQFVNEWVHSDQCPSCEDEYRKSIRKNRLSDLARETQQTDVRAA